MAEAEGAYSLVILTRDAIYGVRDPLGLRPLCIGRLPENGHPAGYVVASESCALGTIGAEFLREVRPGEIVRLDREGIHSTQGVPPAPRPAFCIFEYVYFARPELGHREPNRPPGSPAAWRSPGPRGAGCRRHRRRRARLGHAGRDRLRHRLSLALHRGPDQKPLHRPHLYPARRPAAARRRTPEVQPAAG